MKILIYFLIYTQIKMVIRPNTSTKYFFYLFLPYSSIGNENFNIFPHLHSNKIVILLKTSTSTVNDNEGPLFSFQCENQQKCLKLNLIWSKIFYLFLPYSSIGNENFNIFPHLHSN